MSISANFLFTVEVKIGLKSSTLAPIALGIEGFITYVQLWCYP